MPIHRAQVSLENASGLAKDRVVNTFFFESNAFNEANRAAVSSALVKLYGDPMPGVTYRLGNLISPVIDRTKSVIRQYNMDDAEPRQPYITSLALPAATSTSGIPNEVALCVSYYAGRNLPRLRGRVYLGPWGSGMIPGEAQDSRPSVANVDAIAAQFRLLANGTLMGGSPVPAAWKLYSRRENGYATITAGWVDNAFDTQRRRGTLPTYRKTWS